MEAIARMMLGGGVQLCRDRRMRGRRRMRRQSESDEEGQNTGRAAKE